MTKFFVRIFNFLTILTSGLEFKKVGSIVAFCVLVCFLLCFIMLGKIPVKIAFFIDSFSLQQEKVMIGEGSDISIKGVPKDYLEIKKIGDSIRWSVNYNFRNSDTLQYFKINNDNPNRIEIHNSDEQKIHVSIRSSVAGKDSTLELSITGKDVWNEWRNFEKQKEILLRHFVVYYQSEHAGYNVKDPYGFMQQKNVRSFFSRIDEEKLYLVILDRETIVDTSLGSESYTFEGTVVAHGGTKVQFFRVNDYCYLDNNDDAGFKVDSINYAMKAGVKLTEWGAGHFMINHNGTAWNIFFPKAIGYVETLDTLQTMSQKTGNYLTIKQGEISYPSKNDIYLPCFSTQMPNDICSFDFFNDKVFMRKSYNDSTEVVSKWNIAPTLKPFCIDTGHGKINGRIGYIDRSFIGSYVLVPIIVACILILLVICPLSPVRLPKNIDKRYRITCKPVMDNYYWYLSLLIAITLCYCICKIMIALKLSYTYPYFEKLTGITPVSTSLILLLFFTLAMVLNTPLLRVVSQCRKGYSYPFMAVSIITVLYLGLVFYFFKVLDPTVSKSVISSYYPSEIFNINILNWMDSAGINDTHRSVVYALLFVEGIVLVVWAIVILPFWTRISNKTKHFNDFSQAFITNTKNAIARKWDKYENSFCIYLKSIVPDRIHIEKAELRCDDPKEEFNFLVWVSRLLGRLPFVLFLFFFVGLIILLLSLLDIISESKIYLSVIVLLLFSVCLLSFKMIYIAIVKTIETLFPGHLILLFMLIVIGSLAGNFGTAFITLGVVIGLTNALSSVRFDNPATPEQEGVQPLEGMWQMLFITGIYIACAMFADQGYLTNYVGFLICFICFYFLMRIPGWRNLLHRSIYRKTIRFIYLYLAVVLSILVFLPSICSRIYDPNEVHYNRMARRLMLFSNFENIQNSGYRYTESDAEFMVIMNHYMQHPSSEDPLSNDLHILHPSVSSGQSPVVLNDLSLPIAFFGSYGTELTTMVFFLLLLSLLTLVMQYSIHSGEEKSPVLYSQMQWRLMAVFMWVGTSIYIYLSYLGYLPFTGRLIPGFGVDAVGEALETSLLLAFMSAIAFMAQKTLVFNDVNNW